MIEPIPTNRLAILENSLKKKNEKFDSQLNAHFADVKNANGQPLNDKRNGQRTMNRWERQNDSLRNLKKEIEKTERAIEIEQGKINYVAAVKNRLPNAIVKAIDEGKIIQWRKHANRFFVPGVAKTRIIWDEKKKKLYCSHVSFLNEIEIAKKFHTTFYEIKNELDKEIK